MSAPERVRFTAWLSEQERQLMREIARANGTSENYVLRVALRAALGLPLAPADQQLGGGDQEHEVPA